MLAERYVVPGVVYRSAPGLKCCLQVSSLKKSLKRDITQEGKDEGLMALIRKFWQEEDPDQQIASEIQQGASPVSAQSSDLLLYDFFLKL